MVALSEGDLQAFVILCLLYFLPVVIAFSRQHHQKGAIAVVNTLLGWTFVGWVVALAMACSAVKGVEHSA